MATDNNNTFKSSLKVVAWTLRLLFSFSPKLFIGVLFFLLFATIIPFVEQRYFSHLIDTLIQSVSVQDNAWISVFVIFILIRFIGYIVDSIYKYFDRRLEFSIRFNLMRLHTDKTSSLDYQQYEDSKIQTLISKVREEYQWRTTQILDDTFFLLTQVISFITVLIILVPRYWYIALLLLIGTIPQLIVDRKWQKKNWKVFNYFREKNRPGWDAAWQVCNKQYIAELKINQAIDWLKDKFLKGEKRFNQARVMTFRSKFVPDNLSLSFSTIIESVCLFIILSDIQRGILSVGLFTFYFGIIRQTRNYFNLISVKLTSMNEHSLHVNNFKTIVELKPALANGHIRKGISGPPLIEFINVSFKYPHSKRYVFRHLNLTINPGEEIALVGKNGAGKSTLIKLLCRFYDPTEGQILINGINLKDLDYSYYYQYLSLLTQEFNAYPNLSVKDNVAIGLAVDENRVIESLKSSEAYDFVSKYKSGIDTMLSARYDGEEPSWGQWQKIAIARVFYRNTPIIVLDEPTASIDAVSEYKIFNRLYKHITGKTIIVVSHRFSTVRNAQRIIVVDKGTIVEQGSHEQLIASGGLYSQSFQLQAEGYR